MLETRWHIVRHAPVDNPEGRIYGASDKPANTSDITAFQALARPLPTGAVSVTRRALIRILPCRRPLTRGSWW